FVLTPAFLFYPDISLHVIYTLSLHDALPICISWSCNWISCHGSKWLLSIRPSNWRNVREYVRLESTFCVNFYFNDFINNRSSNFYGKGSTETTYSYS